MSLRSTTIVLGNKPQETAEFEAIHTFCIEKDIGYELAQGRDWVDLRLPKQLYQQLIDWLLEQGYKKATYPTNVTFTAPSQE
jgi:hypothetical protein